MPARQLENPFDQIRPHERPGGVMHGDKLGRGARLLETTQDGILPAQAAWDDGHHFLETLASNHLFVLGEMLGVRHKHDPTHGLRLLEGGDGMRDDRFASERREELVEAHALAAATGNDNGGEHESPTSGENVQRSTSNVQRSNGRRASRHRLFVERER